MEISKKERFFANYIKNQIKEESYTFFDIGANKGFYTDFLIEHFGSDHKVYLFEASDRFTGLLKDKFNSSESLSVINKAVSDEVGTVSFFELEDSNNDVEGMSSLNKREVFSQYKTNEKKVDCITFDNFIDDNNISNVKFVKIDTEGFELNVLKGMKKSLERGIVDYIQIEYGDCITEIGKGIFDIMEFINDYDYKLFDEDNGELIEVDNKRASILRNKPWDNFLIKKNGK